MAAKSNIWLLAAAVGALLAAGGTAVYRATRGLRNNNPGNIRHSSDKWQGMQAKQTDPEFVQFVSPEYGIRALAKLLLNYQLLHGRRTVRQLINRWAPPTENDTGAYVAHVAARLGVDPDASISVSAHLPVLVEAIIRHENGLQPYSAQTIARAIRMAEGVAV